jgi:16S rRNA (adenine1518-N6/adenine1519-N6)-dimethyltransferase
LPPQGSDVVEVGPGTGNLTEALLAVRAERGTPVGALRTIERDRRMREVLADRFGDAVQVIEADAAAVDWGEVLADLGERPTVVGNLPYYAALPILFAVLEAPRPPARLVCMVQREVADRLLARPSTPDYGQVSVKVQMRAEVRLGLRVGRGAFTPVPKVESAVVVLDLLAAPRFPVPDWARFSALVTAGFAQRRKTLSNSLTATLGLAAADVREALGRLGLDERIRGEALSVAQWAALAGALDGAVRLLHAR